jgi:hypothetical protein
VDRIDFEELALKGVDPSLGPSILPPSTPNLEHKSTNEKQASDSLRLTVSPRFLGARAP